MKNKIIGLLLLICMPLTLVSSCAQNGTPSETSKDQTEEVSTAAPETEAPKYEDVSPNELTKDVSSEELALTPYCVKESHSCVKATLEDGVCRITPFCEGEDDVTVYNTFSEKAVIHVKVDSNREMTVTVSPFVKPERSITLKTDLTGTVDISTSLQTLIDSMYKEGGGTVYVPAGSYKIATISIKEKVDLRFEGFVPDARVGYTADVQKFAGAQNMAVLETNGKASASFFFVNVDLPQKYCTDGYSNFSISGGMFKCNGKMKFIAFACAENVRFENILIKDIPNNHAFQIEGSENVTLCNLMFAGYNYPENDPVITRETIQLEPTTPGAIGSNYDTNIIKCNDGDYHHCRNVRITGCYFGASDKYGPQLVAVGHHSASGGLVCDGFEFCDNVVDNPLYCGLHLPNYINVTVSGNKFISTEKYGTKSLAADTALISLYYFDKTLSYTDPTGSKITYLYNYELPGCQNFEIFNNEFEIGGDTYLRAFRCIGLNNTFRNYAEYVSGGALRVTEYAGKAFLQDGYLIKTNCMYNINVYDNVFNIVSQPKYTNCFMYVQNVCGFTCENNTVNLADGVKFSMEWNGVNGVNGEAILMGKNTYSRKITLKKSDTAKVSFIVNGKTEILPVSGNVSVSLLSDGNGSIDLTNDENGNLYVNVTPFDGYVFSGWTNKNGTPVDFTSAPQNDDSYTANFVNK